MKNITEINRHDLSNIIYDNLELNKDKLINQYHTSGPINYFFIDEVFPPEIAELISSSFPSPTSMMLRKSLRETKYVSSQMNKYNSLLEETIFAFHDPRIVEIISNITRIDTLEPDEYLYAGGISLMGRGHYLNPHLDNSHDKIRSRYRVLNLLYYASADWKIENGGNLELWQNGLKSTPLTIQSKFNRLAVMVTHEKSWHSVSPVLVDCNRLCISNYYFSKDPVGGKKYFNVTSFRGRPEQPIRDFLLRSDNFLRMMIRKLYPKGIHKVKHYYKK